MLQKLFYRLNGLMIKAVNHYLDFYRVGQASKDPRPEDGFFQTTDGRRLPVFKNYRYSIKPGWNYFPSLSALHTLIQKGLVATAIRSFFKEAIGNRTLQRPLLEIDEVALRVAMQYQNVFFPETLEPVFQPVPIPSDKEISSRITTCCSNHRVLFSKLNSFEVDIPTQRAPKVLEIGYISGGYSLFALERLGFQAFGIDNFYGDSTQRNHPGDSSCTAAVTSALNFLLKTPIVQGEEIHEDVYLKVPVFLLNKPFATFFNFTLWLRRSQLTSMLFV